MGPAQGGRRRVVFGSDYPVDDPLTAVRAVAELGFSDEEEAAILHNNAGALLTEAPLNVEPLSDERSATAVRRRGSRGPGSRSAAHRRSR